MLFMIVYTFAFFPFLDLLSCTFIISSLVHFLKAHRKRGSCKNEGNIIIFIC